VSSGKLGDADLVVRTMGVPNDMLLWKNMLYVAAVEQPERYGSSYCKKRFFLNMQNESTHEYNHTNRKNKNNNPI
jgi:hypothetical protein